MSSPQRAPGVKARLDRRARREKARHQLARDPGPWLAVDFIALTSQSCDVCGGIISTEGRTRHVICDIRQRNRDAFPGAPPLGFCPPKHPYEPPTEDQP